MKPLYRWIELFFILSLLTACISLSPAPTQTLPVPTLEATPAATFAPTETPAAALTPTAISTPVSASQPWWNDRVFYEIFVRSFYDSNGDGVGDINGLIEKLDYLNDGNPATTTDLGITGIWLMPINASPSYHGYDVVDYYTVNKQYGTNEDFKRLMTEAHKRGIKVIIDLVVNHTSSDHPWFKASDAGDPIYRDWYIWANPAPTYSGPWGEQVWYPGKNGYYYAVFWSGMPDLNLKNPKVTAEIDKVASFWLKEMGVDGFRLDAIKHLVEQGATQENTLETHAWLQAFHTYYKSVNPEAFTIGEAWTTTSEVLKYIGSEVDIAFMFDLAGALVDSANGPIAIPAINQMTAIINSYPKGQYGVFLTNHDQNRSMSLLNNVDKAKLAAVMLLTAPGVPFIYYGEEIGMTGMKPDEDIRRPMQWNGENGQVGFTAGTAWRNPASDYKETNVALETNDPNSLLSIYRALIQLRNEHPSLRTGDALMVNSGARQLYALLRYNENEAFLILVNVSPKPLTADLYNLTLENGPFKGTLRAVTVMGQANPAELQVNANGGFTNYQPWPEIPARSYTIIQLTP